MNIDPRAASPSKEKPGLMPCASYLGARSPPMNFIGSPVSSYLAGFELESAGNL